MTTNINKHIIARAIAWIRQLLFSHVSFILSIGISVVFNILSSHANANLPIRHFFACKILSNQIFLAFTYLITQSHVPGFHTQSFSQNDYLILYTHTNIHSDSIFALNYIHFYSIHVYTCPIHVEMKILFCIHMTIN